MSLRRSRIAIAAVVSASLMALGVVGSSGAANSDPAGQTSIATTLDSAADTSEPPAPETAEVEILAPDESWGGLTRDEWDARSWQWNLSLPADINAWWDPTGKRCGHGQSGPVFFLTGYTGPSDNQRCVVAEGTAIYVAAASTECSTVEAPPFFGRNEEELRACAREEIDGTTDVQARVNGEAVANLDAYRTSSPMFTVILPENNVFGVEPGVAQAVSDGYSFIIAPPPPGQYEVAWTAKYPADTETRAYTATVVVEAAQVIEPSTEPTADDVTAHTEPEHTIDSVPASLAVDGSSAAASPEVEAFCTAEVATENAVRSEDPALIGPAVEAVIAAAPDDESRTIVQAVADTFQAGGPAFDEAYAELVDYMRANCGFAELDIVASEYAFSGIPAELPAGPMIISFENIGSEVHEVTFIRFNDDVTLSLGGLFVLPVEQQQSLATFHGMFYADPGDFGARVYDLVPGRYVALCFLPEHADPEIMLQMEGPNPTEPEGADFGPQHWLLGMIHQFTAS